MERGILLPNDFNRKTQFLIREISISELGVTAYVT